MDILQTPQKQKRNLSQPKRSSKRISTRQQIKRQKHCRKSSARQLEEGKNNEDSLWEIEDILDERRNSHGSREVLIKWKEWASEYNSWEPIENLEGDLTEVFKSLKSFKEAKETQLQVNSETNQEQESYQIENILREKIEEGRHYYLVKWLGFPFESSTWETLNHLTPEDLAILRNPLRFRDDQNKIFANRVFETHSREQFDLSPKSDWILEDDFIDRRIINHQCDRFGYLIHLQIQAVNKQDPSAKSVLYWVSFEEARIIYPVQMMEYLMERIKEHAIHQVFD